ncbi:MAG TPA: glutathione S-transferase family protein [Methylobacter sp.]|jgi:glutathione S-transferase
MSIKFYYGSGSPFSWNVWLVLEHKQLPYQFNLLSLQNGELKQPDYLAINPHGKVPTLVDDGFAIWEALTIVEYLEERYPEYPVFPSKLKDRASARRLSAEACSYLYPVLRRLMELTLFRQDNAGDPAEITLALEDLSHELSYVEDALHDDYFVGTLSSADFAIYPLLALVKRLHERLPQLGAGALIGPKLAAFMERIEHLPYFVKTTPPHWQG